MKLVYIAGPYRGQHPYLVKQNIYKADLMAIEVHKLGLQWYPNTPHTANAHHEGVRDDQYFLNGTMELLKASHAVLVLDGYDKSTGTLGEIAMANMLGIPVFYSLEAFARWARAHDAAAQV